MVSAHAYPTFKLSDTLPLLLTAARAKSGEIPYCPAIPSLTVLVLTIPMVWLFSIKKMHVKLLTWIY